MRALKHPTATPDETYLTCVNSISNENLRSRLKALVNSVNIAANEYLIKGNDNTLYTIPANNGGNDDLVLGNVTKKELKDVYSTHMVGFNKPARSIYDSILYGAPFNRCPFCGVGQVSTLDHYLPKSKYPLLSVTPPNLIPCCKDCNTGKSSDIAQTKGQQSLHPYFDKEYFFNEQWIFADVIPTTPETVNFFVKAPDHWDQISKERVQSHFQDFNLARRFSIESANEIASQQYFFETQKNRNIHDLISLLNEYADSNYRNQVNSWKTAFYQAFSKHYAAIAN